MYGTGRKLLGWIGLLSGLAALLVLVFGLVFPPGLQAAEPLLCSSGTTVETNPDQLDLLRRGANSSDWSQFCTSPSQLDDVTTRWFLVIIGGFVLSGLSYFMRARLTPPVIRAPSGAG